jgi:acyl-lipid omega-3 desaturase
MAPNTRASVQNENTQIGGISMDFAAKKKETLNPALNLAKIRKCIPPEAFEKSLFWSCFYMVFDYTMWFGATYLMYQFVQSPEYATYSPLVRHGATFVYWNFCGFFMWCIFVVGHDCGHGTFSNYFYLNEIIGLITHGSICVPYHPWKLTHHRHHSYHNHADRDYSHPWYTPDKLAPEGGPEFALARAMENYTWMRFLFPFIGWAIYLFGLPDGSHFFPVGFMGKENNRVWNESLEITGDYSDHRKCLLSTSVVFGYCYCMMEYLFKWDWSAFGYWYVGPALVYGWWLVTVTYLQHHDHSTLVFDDADWNFVYSAFETIDRKFGFGIDALHHHITDGHVAHHLFFKNIPHYNLPIATEAVYKYMADNKLAHLVKTDKTHDFPARVHQYMVQFGFAANRFSPENYTAEAVKARRSRDEASRIDLVGEVSKKNSRKTK